MCMVFRVLPNGKKMQTFPMFVQSPRTLNRVVLTEGKWSQKIFYYLIYVAQINDMEHSRAYVLDFVPIANLLRR